MNDQLLNYAVESAKGGVKTNPRLMTDDKDVQYFPSKSLLTDPNLPLDRDWAKRAFLTPDSNMNQSVPDGSNVVPLDIHNRYYSTAHRKYTDTTLGGNIGINARPQFTPYADIRVKGRMPYRQDVTLFDYEGNYGLGRYYSESIDDYSQVIYLQFGVPEYSSLMSFFSRAFSPYSTAMAHTGRPPSFWRSSAQLVGELFTIGMFPIASIAIVLTRGLTAFVPSPTHKYYTLKETMTAYWMSVNALVNYLAVNNGLFPKNPASNKTKVVGGKEINVRQMGMMFEPDTDYMKFLSQMLPGVIDGDYGYDMFAVANKAQRLANRLSRNRLLNNESGSQDYVGVIVKEVGGAGDAKDIADEVSKPDWNKGLIPWLLETVAASVTFSTYDAADPNSAAGKVETQNYWDESMTNVDGKAVDGWSKYFDAELRQGSKFAIFRVDYTGPVQESFSNSIGESEISNKYNSMSGQSKEAKFTVMGGKLGDGILADMVQGIVGAAVNVASGAVEGMTLGLSNGLSGLAGAGYIDIPKVWQNSTASLPKSNYTIQLISPYGNVVSRMQNLYIPLAMLLAGALPLSTGKSSYTSPFLVSLYDRGRNQVKTGIIESLSVTRGTSNLGFTKEGKILAIDVSFSITDLSSIMHMPITTGSPFSAGILQGLANIALGQIGDVGMDADNILMDYLAVLAGQDMYSQVYFGERARMNMVKYSRMKNAFFNPHRWAMVVNDEMAGGVLKLFPVGIFSNTHVPLWGSAITDLNAGTDVASNNHF